VVSLPPAETTSDQCVVTNAGRGGGSAPVEVEPGWVWLEVVTGANVTPFALKTQAHAVRASIDANGGTTEKSARIA
jgi:hypothetical protein